MNKMLEEEGRLSFIKFARGAFEFLVHLGFIETQTESTFIRFENQTMFINIYHGRMSYQASAEIGRLVPEDAYTLYEVFSVFAPDEVRLSGYQTTNSELLAIGLGQMADVIQRCCIPLLSGDVAAFEKLQLGVAPIRKELTMRFQFGAIISRANLAWEAKDKALAKRLYEEAEIALSATEKRRLKYLRTHS